MVAYFYFDFNDMEKRQAWKAIRSLLSQLAAQNSLHLQTLEQLHQRCRDGSQQPDDSQVQSLLFTIIGQMRRTYIVLDALDECEDRHELLTFLEDLTASSQYKVCVLVTSRPEQDIGESLRPIAHQTVNLQSAVVDPDIDAYVRSRLSSDQKLKKWPTAVRDEIAEVFRQKADGMFRWVYCQLESLKRCVQLRDLRTALSSLPETLDETYARILDNIETEGHLNNAIVVLQWLCFADRPLRLSELVDVLAIERGDNVADGFDPEQRLPDPKDVLTICSSLVSPFYLIRDSDGDLNWSDHTDTNAENGLDEHGPLSDYTTQIRLAHFSVQEYLLSDRCHLNSEFQPMRCHTILAEGCLYYLQHIGNQPVSISEVAGAYPLAKYVAASWWRHAYKVQNEPDTCVTDLAYHTLSDPHRLKISLHLYNVEKPWRSGKLNQWKELASPVYYAARLGLHEIVKKSIIPPRLVHRSGGRFAAYCEEVYSLDEEEGGDGTALRSASLRDYEKIVQILLEAGADVNAPGQRHGSALQAASSMGHERIVLLLLKAGAEVDALGGFYGSALIAASTRGHENVVRILLQAGANTNVKGGYRSTTALLAASAGGHVVILQLLLEAGAKVNARGNNGGNALQVAATQGREQVVRILLQAGARVNVHTKGPHGSALTAASARGDEKIVEMLIEAGAVVDYASGGLCTALQAAALEGHDEVAKVLIEAGANVNKWSGLHGTALQAASRGGHEKVVKTLIAAGADVNAITGNYDTALQAASIHGHKEVVRILIENGADVEAHKEGFDNALQAARAAGREEIARMLIEAGADESTIERMCTNITGDSEEEVASDHWRSQHGGSISLDTGGRVQLSEHWNGLQPLS